jgi:glutamate dehydrogenase (NAD(P)+)
VPAAISYAIIPDNTFDVAAKVIVEAANAATTPEAEAMLRANGIPVIPDFVANAGAAAWAWWLLLGQVGSDPAAAFHRLRTEMRARVALLLDGWITDGRSPRQTAWQLAVTRRDMLAADGPDQPDLVIP